MSFCISDKRFVSNSFPVPPIFLSIPVSIYSPPSILLSSSSLHLCPIIQNILHIFLTYLAVLSSSEHVSTSLRMVKSLVQIQWQSLLMGSLEYPLCSQGYVPPDICEPSHFPINPVRQMLNPTHREESSHSKRSSDFPVSTRIRIHCFS